MGRKGAVAAGNADTAEAAEIILQEGGNAFDAVLGAMCAATVAEPVLASLGGGGFMLARPHNGKAALYDFFAHTPKTKRPIDDVDFKPILADFGTVTQEFHIGLGAMAVPGVPRGLFRIHADLGRMPLRDVVAPAVKLARDGVTIHKLQAYVLEIVKAIYTATPESRAQYASPSQPERLLQDGDVFKVPDFADFLDVLAREGEDLFYRGEVAQRLIADCQAGGGYLTLADLKDYRVDVREPLSVDYGDWRLYTNPPPSSGGLLIAFALELLKGVDLAAMTRGGIDHIATLAKVMKLTNKARIDADLHDVGEDADAARRLLDPAFLARYRDEVHGRPEANRGTTHISVIDGDGNAATLTLSNGEGAAYIIPGTGIMMNNMLGEEDINPAGFHQWAENTRMASMMAPSLLVGRDGREVALGSGGSNRIRTAILQVIVNLIDFGLPVDEAVAAPRIHYERGLLNLEGGIDPDLERRLAVDYEDVKLWPDLNLFYGGVHAVGYDPKGNDFFGGGDPRRGGVARLV